MCVCGDLQKKIRKTGPELRYGEVYHIKNSYGSGSWLDTRGSGCEGNELCVSTATSNTRHRGSGSWKIWHETGSYTGYPVRNGDIVYLVNQYDQPRGYLDTRGSGCEDNKLCVSTANTGNRDSGSGKWKIVADPAVDIIDRLTPVHLLNQYRGFGGYLDTRGSGCEGNEYCVSTSATKLRDRGSTFWVFYD